MELLVSGLLSVVSVVFYRRVMPPGRPAGSIPLPYGWPDALFALLLIAWFVSNLLGSQGREVVITAPMLVANAVFTGLLLVCLAAFLVFRSLNPLKIFGLNLPGFRRSVAIAPLALLAALPVIYFVHALSHRAFGEPPPQPLVQFLMQNAGWNDRLLLAFTAIVVAPVSEEVIFRGYLYGTFRRYAGRGWALGVSAVIFAAIHAHLPALGGLLVLAVVLTLIYEYTTSLWGPIVLHALFNTLTVTATLLWPDTLP